MSKERKEELENKIKELWASANVCYKHGNLYEYLSYAKPIKELTDEMERNSEEHAAKIL
jgi:hypothetical protein